ncbi:MAG TPA: carbamoyltransferase HypF [Candidatus Ratteibacteria bacterium]|nr:carbamoyltransferase HypF [Candidatus Ratteibacteria bacterium]
MMKKSLRIFITGVVQGVGFRPFVYRSAKKHCLSGFVKNTVDGVFIEIKGNNSDVDNFLDEIKNSHPQGAKIRSIIAHSTPGGKAKTFKILKSSEELSQQPEIPPDIAICNHCRDEIFDKKNRRYGYPFTNCVDCGPRFTILNNLPYDRKNTSMKKFKMCPECKKEYILPDNRRFHAQTNCCQVCGPKVFLICPPSKLMAKENTAIIKTAKLLQEGKIIAIKGIGGFHLACDALSKASVKYLRERKKREEKPFAVMARDIQTIEEFCDISDIEKQHLLSSAAPILLLKKKNIFLFDDIAPHNRYLGVMLPYTGVHQLIFANSNLKMLVMTSGNISEEPICTQNKEVVEKLSEIADFFLFHDRDIISGCDDSVIRVLPDKKVMMIRKSRGYAPDAILSPFKIRHLALGCGSDIKNTFCFGVDKMFYISHHIGDLENISAMDLYKTSINRYRKLLRFDPEIIAYDAHPDYFSSSISLSDDFFPDCRKIPVYHHHAHICSCMVENNLKNQRVIGVAFDGTGYGNDGNLWGSEFLVCDYSYFENLGHLRPIRLPGGEKAIKEIWRIAVAYLYDAFGKDFERNLVRHNKPETLDSIIKMIEKGINSPYSRGMGRFFDAVSCICGLRNTVSYEGQAAMEIESLLSTTEMGKPYNFDIADDSGIIIIDQRRTIRELVNDLNESLSLSMISLRFHSTIVKMIYDVCRIIRKKTGIIEVVLSGGCFQNVFLSVNVKKLLEKNGFNVYVHNKLPSNDACISVGQAAIAGFLK